MIEIQSRQNAALKHLARLGRERKYRRSTGEMLCEGEKMLTEALSHTPCMVMLDIFIVPFQYCFTQ